MKKIDCCIHPKDGNKYHQQISGCCVTDWIMLMLEKPSVPDELVKDCRTVCCFPQHHGAVVARQQQLLEHVALHGEDQAVGLDHLHLVRVDGLHAQSDVAAVPHGQQALHTLHQVHGVVQHRGPGVQYHVLLQGCCGDNGGVEQTHYNSFLKAGRS